MVFCCKDIFKDEVNSIPNPLFIVDCTDIVLFDVLLEDLLLAGPKKVSLVSFELFELKGRVE